MKKTVIALCILAIVSTAASAELLPPGDWKDLLHLGATADDHINGDGTDVDYLNGEATLMPAPGDSVTVTNDDGTTQTLVWTPLHDDDGRWTPDQSFDHYIRYWHLYIISPEEREVTFKYGHDDQIRVWNNGELIITDGTSYDGILHAGQNSIMIKLHEGGGGDYMKIAVTDRAGNDMTDLHYTFAPVGVNMVNPNTGSTGYVNQPLVDLVWQDGSLDVVGYQITETDVEPTEWQTTAPTSYTLPGGEGDYTLYGWVKTADGQVISSVANITYSTLAPVASAKDISVEIMPPSYPPAVIYPADADDGSNDPLGGDLLTGPEYYYITCPEDQAPGQPYVSLPATTPTQYTAILTVTNEAGNTATVPFLVDVVEGQLPTTDPVVWDGEGGSANQQWSRGQNWLMDQAPANPTPGSVTFSEFGGNAPDDNSTTNVLTPGAAKAVTANAEPFAFAPGDALGVAVNGGQVQVVTIDAADITAATAAEVADSMNTFAVGFSALPTVDGKVEITAEDASPSSLVFSNIGGDPAGVLGLPVDEPVVPEWTIGKLIVQKSTTPDTTMAEDYSHTTDLNGGKLNIQQDFSVHYPGKGNYGVNNYTLKNGSVVLGSPDTLRNFTIVNYGGYSQGGATVTFAPGVKFEPYINTLRINQCMKNIHPVTLDLRGVDIAGGLLKLKNLYVGYNTNSKTALMVDETTNLSMIEVDNDFAVCHRVELGEGYIGDPDNDRMLPPNVSIKIGNKDETGNISRGNLYVGVSRNNGADGKLAASSGGTFEAYVNNLQVGSRFNWYHNRSIGLLDLSQMDSVMIDANSVLVGIGVENNVAKTDGTIVLPPGGTLTANSVEMGDLAETSLGLIDLRGATMTVNQTLTMKENSKIAVAVQGASCGLDMPTDVAFSTVGNASIEVIFETDQTEGEGLYYGLRWAGDHLGDLQPLVDAGTLVFDDTAVTGSAGLYYDEATDATYVTVMETWPLTAVAKNLTIEVDPADPTAIVTADDIEAGSFDPNGYTIVSYVLNSSDDQTPAEDYVTLNGLGEHTVTLIVTNDNDPADLASKDATVTLVERAATTANDVTWTGGASLANMERPEWTWGSNWLGGNAPQNPTTATVTFTAMGQGTNKLEGSRAIIIGERTEPFMLYVDDQIAVDASGTLTTFTFTIDQFADIGNATAQEIADVLNADAAGFEASAVDGRIVLQSDAGPDSTLQVVEVTDGIATRLGLPTASAAAERMVGSIEFLNPLNSGFDLVEHTTDLNGQKLTITNELRSGWYFDQSTDHLSVAGTLTNGELTLGSADAPANVLVGYGGYAGKSNATLTLGPGVTLNENIGLLALGKGSHATEAYATLDLLEAVDADGDLKVQDLYMGTDGNTNDCQLLFNANTNLQTLSISNSVLIGSHAFNNVFIGDPETQMLPPGVSVKFAASDSPGSFVFGDPGYYSGTATLVAAAGGTFEAYATDFIVGRNRSPYGFCSPVVTLDASAMDSCTVEADNMEIGTTDRTDGGSGTNTILLALPEGTATVDTLKMGAPGYNEASTATLQLDGTDFVVNTSAVMHVGSKIDIRLDGTSSGLDIELADLTVEDGALISITFAAPVANDPYYGLKWAGSHEAELQALIDAGKIVTDTTAVGADAVVYTDADYTYIGVQTAAPTLPIEGDANMDCKVNIIDLIFVRNRLNGDVASDDNWQADVNGDGKINIIDLIYVRNRLNTKCPE